MVFLALFCRAKPYRIGKWKTRQRRSYFSARLTEDWWVWGIDIALVRDMDQPQSDYFEDEAMHMPKGANIILCSAEPGWYHGDTDGKAFQTIDYAAWIARRVKRDLKIPLVLSGDSHHFAHYAGPDCAFVTSGGGGAFLHGTLDVREEIPLDWLTHSGTKLKLETAYPGKEQSRKLLDTEMSFFTKNREASLGIGIVYWLMAFILTSWFRLDVALLEFGALFGILYAYVRYQESGRGKPVFRSTLVHALAHFAVILIISIAALALFRGFDVLLPALAQGFRDSAFASVAWMLWLAALAPVVGLAAPVGAWIFGTYLSISCKRYDLNHNDAFSAMNLDGYRQFLRMRIKGGTLTIFPVGIDRTPRRDEWRLNKARGERRPSMFEPAESLNPALIGNPITIGAGEGLRIDEIQPRPEVIIKG